MKNLGGCIIRESKTKLHFFLAALNSTSLFFKFGPKILDLFPNIEDLFFMPTSELIKLGLPKGEADKLKKPNWDRVEQDLKWAQQPDNHIITILDSSYPNLLKEIPSPPIVLFASGNIELLNLPQLAVVGSRNPTRGGLETAFWFAQSLAQAGLVVTSGFAAGIDAASHRGAICCGGKTIAVMGTGLNCIYPCNHLSLAKKIVSAGGVLISEFSLLAKPISWHFPLRNRIISGLSIGTLIVEATIRSGSLITARLAGEYGREVFAIPGSINNPLARGSHHLISQGAILVENPNDILKELPKSYSFKKISTLDINNTKKFQKNNKLDCKYKKLLDCMGYEIVSFDILMVRTNFSVKELNNFLLELEMAGLIQTVIGGYIKK